MSVKRDVCVIKCLGRLTRVWVNVLVVATANVHASRVLLNEPHDFVQVAQRQVVVLEESLGSSVWIL